MRKYERIPLLLQSVEDMYEIADIKEKLAQYMEDLGDFTVSELAAFMGKSPKHIANAIYESLESSPPTIEICNNNHTRTELAFRDHLDSKAIGTLSDAMQFRYVGNGIRA